MSRAAETSTSLLRGRILRDVWQERERQEELCRQGKFTHTAASPDLPNGYRLTALVEEVGEAAEAVLERDGYIGKPKGTDLRKELVQVAAVAVAWIEALDRTADPTPKASTS